jgi:hypothetical protein
VDKVVDKVLLTARNASVDAGSNKMPVPKAIFFHHKIKHLQSQERQPQFIFLYFV